jgi:hypothetical protein
MTEERKLKYFSVRLKEWLMETNKIFRVCEWYLDHTPTVIGIEGFNNSGGGGGLMKQIHILRIFQVHPNVMK